MAFVEDARFYREKLIANTFIMEDDDETIAFFSLLNDKISQTTIDKKTIGENFARHFRTESTLEVIPL